MMRPAPPPPSPPGTTRCGLCAERIAYGQRGNHARGHGVRAWDVVWSPPGAFPCTAHVACVATGHAYGNASKLAGHIARLALNPPQPIIREPRLCELPHCDRSEKASGLCSGHLTRRDRGLTNWDGPLGKPRSRRDPAATARETLGRHGVITTIELPPVVLQALADVLQAHEGMARRDQER